MSMLRRHWPWLLVLVILLAFPFLFYDWSKGRHSGFVLTLMSEIGVLNSKGTMAQFDHLPMRHSPRPAPSHLRTRLGDA